MHKYNRSDNGRFIGNLIDGKKNGIMKLPTAMEYLEEQK